MLLSISRSNLYFSTTLVIFVTHIHLSIQQIVLPGFTQTISPTPVRSINPASVSSTANSSHAPIQGPFQGSLQRETDVQCIHIPTSTFARKATEMLLAVTSVHPGPPDFQPFAAYGEKSYWFLNNGHGWDIRIIPEVGLSYNNLVLWWDLELRQSVIRIIDRCVDRKGMGGRQRWAWQNSDNFLNPDTRIEVQVWRGTTDVPVRPRPNKDFCAIC